MKYVFQCLASSVWCPSSLIFNDGVLLSRRHLVRYRTWRSDKATSSQPPKTWCHRQLLFFRKRMGQVSFIVFCTGLHVFSMRYTPEPRGASQWTRQWPAAIASLGPQIIVNGVFVWFEMDNFIKIKQSYRPPLLFFLICLNIPHRPLDCL